MMKQVKNFRMLMIMLICAIAGVTSVSAWQSNGAASDHRPGSQPSCVPGRGRPAEIEAAKLYVEYNATDEDLGVHGAFDDSGWSKLCVYDPNGKLVLAVHPKSQLRSLTMASIFFESREPELSEFSFDDLVATFPEGDYTVQALSYERAVLNGTAVFTHDVPVPPEITYPLLAEDEETANNALVPATNLTVSWDAVTETVFGDAAAITGYELIVTKVEHDDPNGFSRPIFDVHVGPDQTNLTVSDGFLEANTVYELEVLALEESGNQTISVGFFKTE